MKAALWDKINHISIVDIPMPEAKSGHVVVKVKAVGVCATDIHTITGKVKLQNPPHVLGHEIAGEIYEVGDNVVGWKKGDRVVIDTIISCGRCKACKSGRREQCAHRMEIGYAPYQGGYAEYVCVPAQCLVSLPENIDFRDAAILESIACPFGSVLRIGVKPGADVLVQGGGPAGIAYIQGAKISGAKKIIASVRGAKRMEYAKYFGADEVIDAEHEDVVSRVLELTNGEGCDCVMDAAGSPESIMTCFDACKVGGDVFFYGIPPENAEIPFPFMKMLTKQLCLHGVLEYCAGWDTLTELVGAGRVNVHDMVTHTFTLDNISEAIELYEKKDRSLIKSVIVF